MVRAYTAIPLRPRSNLGGGVYYILFFKSMEPNSKSEIGIGTYGCYSSFKSNILVVSAVKVNL